ncbi:hypothetical protein STCU_11908 [Strigomonas culicis]|uniref:Uncharacterized protein n=1 Tax=Strigomonas culicis TaxID=28005 RepID=S9ULR3_9TRYP|nr:hypothetical protein STCU_11908 [Strigomonas culicis]|eukprot:EPY15591.1 hypothetical protein STCU_11908 [Strigomonas culicis]
MDGLQKRSVKDAVSTSTAEAAFFTKSSAKSKDLCLCLADGSGAFRYCGSLQKVAALSAADAAPRDNATKHPTIAKMPFVAAACCRSHESFVRRIAAARRALGSPSGEWHGGAAPYRSEADALNGPSAPGVATAAGARRTMGLAVQPEDEAGLRSPLHLSESQSLFHLDETDSCAPADLKFAFLVGAVVPLTLLRALNPFEAVTTPTGGAAQQTPKSKPQRTDSLSEGGHTGTAKWGKKANARRRFKLFEEVQLPKELCDFLFMAERANTLLSHGCTSADTEAAAVTHAVEDVADGQRAVEVPQERHAPVNERTAVPETALHSLPHEAVEEPRGVGTATAVASHEAAQDSGGAAGPTLPWCSPAGDPSTYICAEDSAANVQIVREMKAAEDHARAELAAALLSYEKVRKAFDTTASAFAAPDAAPTGGQAGQDPVVYQLMREKIELTTQLALQQQHLEQRASSDMRMLEMQVMHLENEINESRTRQAKLSAITMTNSSHVY